MIHPSGKRELTDREFACLQGQSVLISSPLSFCFFWGQRFMNDAYRCLIDAFIPDINFRIWASYNRNWVIGLCSGCERLTM